MTDYSLKIAKEFAGLLRLELKGHIKKIVLFGSRARGDENKYSDFDVVVILDEKNDKIKKAIISKEVEMMDKHNTLFSSLKYSQQEWDKLQGFPIAWNINNEGIVL